jgi:hypothetical protein
MRFERSNVGNAEVATGGTCMRPRHPVNQRRMPGGSYGMTDQLGDSVQRNDELEEIRRDIRAIVSKLDLLIDGSLDPAAPEER